MQIYDYGCQNLDNGTVQLFIQVLSGLLALVVLHRMNHLTSFPCVGEGEGEGCILLLERALLAAWCSDTRVLL